MSNGRVFIVVDAPLVGMTLTWSNGAVWVRPNGLSTITLT